MICGMRRDNREIRDRAVIEELLRTSHVGRLGTAGRDGYPMIKPLNFSYEDEKIYFHTAREGEKIDDLAKDNRVCFEVDSPIAYATAGERPCSASYFYRSVIIRGRASLVDDREERLHGLKLLMEKYQPEGGYGAFPEKELDRTGVVRIDIEEMIGKQHLKKD